MKIIPHSPSPLLRSFIQQMWIVEEDSGVGISVRSFPVGYAFLNVISGSRFMIQKEGRAPLHTSSYLVGPTTRPFRLHMKLVKRAITIQLRPFAIPYLLGMPAREFRDRQFSIADFNPALAVRLEELIQSELDSPAVLRQCEKVMTSLLLDYQPNRRMQEAMHLIINHRGTLLISTLKDRLNVSQRRLQQLFDQYIGLPPKSYSRVIKMQYHTFELLRGQKLEAVVPDGYYDQSHFIHDLKRQTGMLPDDFRAYISDPARKSAYYFSNLYFRNT